MFHLLARKGKGGVVSPAIVLGVQVCVSVPKEFASHLAVSLEPLAIGATFHLPNGAVTLVMLILEIGTATVPFNDTGKVNPEITIFLEISANSAALINPEKTIAGEVMIDRKAQAGQFI